MSPPLRAENIHRPVRAQTGRNNPVGCHPATVSHVVCIHGFYFILFIFLYISSLILSTGVFKNVFF